MIRKLETASDLVDYDEFCLLVQDDRKADLIEGTMSRVACRLSRLNAPEPNVLYVRPERAHLVEENQVFGSMSSGRRLRNPRQL